MADYGNFQDILDEFRGTYPDPSTYCECRRVSCKDGDSQFDAASRDIACRVRNAVSSDSTEWFVEDSRGNELHIGDRFFVKGTNEIQVNNVMGFWFLESIAYVLTGSGRMPYLANDCVKVDDSLEAIENDIYLDAEGYCEKHGIPVYGGTGGDRLRLTQVRHLLERQKKFLDFWYANSELRF